LDKIENIDRWRISSIEPNLLTEDIISFVSSSKKFMPHFHVPLQSGSDKILKAMHRKYERSLYQSRVEKIKELIPHACIGVDVIVGFPGETEEDFMDTYNFIHALDISYLHVFTYSERANTNAIKSNEVVPIEERRRRNEMLRILSEKKRHAFYEQHLNTSRKVLFESENDEGYMHGFTDNYIKVKTRYDEALCNSIREVFIDKLLLGGFAGITFENEAIKA
jgi:threonylcarbamoyladenosine tRNA methylthiotransferase MtaB